MCFPKNIFSEAWKDYLFFEPSMLFQPIFIEVTHFLLREERASVLALINLDRNGPGDHGDASAIFLEANTKASEYIAQLKGDGTPMNWLFLMDRYVCASDKNNWVIYCEKENDIAVLAVCPALSTEACLRVEALLKAKSIKNALDPGDNQRFDFNPIVPEWRASLIAEYVPSGE